LIRVYISSVVDASADTVWSRIRDFNGLPQWHPGIADSRSDNREPSDRVGCIRHFHTRLGTIRERCSRYPDGGMIRRCALRWRSDHDEAVRWADEILDKLDVDNVVCTRNDTPLTDGVRCFAECRGEFDCEEERERELVETIGNGVFQGGFDALKRHFARG
jgi:hypothetical protein